MNRFIAQRAVQIAVVTIASFAALPLVAQGSASMSISLNPASPRSTAIPYDFLGISLEMSSVMGSFNSNYGSNPWLQGGASHFGTMLNKIGVRSVRIGGNSSERDFYPSAQEGYDVQAFMQSLDNLSNSGGKHVSFLWTVATKDFYNESSGVSYINGLYNNQQTHSYTFLPSYEIGNEPDNSESDGHSIPYSTWQAEYDQYSYDLRHSVSGSILSDGAAASVGATYSTEFANDSKYQGSLKPTVGFVTDHRYPLSSASGVSVPAGDAKLLDPTRAASDRSSYENWGLHVANDQGFKPRYEETNSAYGGSNNGWTNSYAAALWAADYLCNLAYNESTLAGVNIHTGPIGSDSGSYNPISPVGGTASTPYTLQGPGYGMWAFNYGSQGAPVPTSITNSSNVNVTAYGLLESNNTETVHIINKTFNGAANTSGYINAATDVSVTVTPNGGFTHAQVIYLKQANDDVTQQGGITFGGQPMGTDGTWSGGYGAQQNVTNGKFTLNVPHSEVAVVHFF